jgi:hypothetical protein
MREEVNEKSTAAILAEIRELFGPPPVLSTESEEAYQKILTGLVERYRPTDVIVQMYIKDMADAVWEEARYKRHKILAVDRKFHQRLKFQAERTKLLAQRKEALVRGQAEKAGTPANEADRMSELEDVFESSVHDVDEILKRTPKELDHARALEDCIVYQEQLNRLQTVSTARRYGAHEQLEWYRENSGYDLRHVSNKIIEGECIEEQPQQVAPIAPRGEQLNDL